MNDNQFKYLRNTFRLHKLIAEGKGDGDEADPVRDEMDFQWRACSPEEKTQIKSVGCFCYALTGAVDDPEWYRNFLFSDDELGMTVITAL